MKTIKIIRREEWQLIDDPEEKAQARMLLDMYKKERVVKIIIETEIDPSGKAVTNYCLL